MVELDSQNKPHIHSYTDFFIPVTGLHPSTLAFAVGLEWKKRGQTILLSYGSEDISCNAMMIPRGYLEQMLQPADRRISGVQFYELCGGGFCAGEQKKSDPKIALVLGPSVHHTDVVTKTDANWLQAKNKPLVDSELVGDKQLSLAVDFQLYTNYTYPSNSIALIPVERATNAVLVQYDHVITSWAAPEELNFFFKGQRSLFAPVIAGLNRIPTERAWRLFSNRCSYYQWLRANGYPILLYTCIKSHAFTKMIRTLQKFKVEALAAKPAENSSLTTTKKITKRNSRATRHFDNVFKVSQQVVLQPWLTNAKPLSVWMVGSGDIGSRKVMTSDDELYNKEADSLVRSLMNKMQIEVGRLWNVRFNLLSHKEEWFVDKISLAMDMVGAPSPLPKGVESIYYASLKRLIEAPLDSGSPLSTTIIPASERKRIQDEGTQQERLHLKSLRELEAKFKRMKRHKIK